MRAFWLISALFAAALTLAITDRESGLPMWFELRAERRESENRISQLRFEVKNLQTEVEALEHDPLAMERAIREVLELARPGETVIRFVERDNGPAARLN